MNEFFEEVLRRYMIRGISGSARLEGRMDNLMALFIVFVTSSNKSFNAYRRTQWRVHVVAQTVFEILYNNFYSRED